MKSERNPGSSSTLGLLGVVAALGLLSACAAKPALQASPAAPPAAEGTTADSPAAGGVQSYEPAPETEDDELAVMSLDQAAARFEQAELQITEMLRAAAVPPANNGSDTAPIDPEAAPKPAARQLGEHGDGPDRCLSACRALASMQRSASRLCELTGGDDPRCEDVTDRVEQARRLVLDACPSCIVAQPTDD